MHIKPRSASRCLKQALLAATILAAATPVFAQEAAAVTELDLVVVTGKRVSEASVAIGTDQATAFEMPVQVPEECGAQWLRLRNAARVPALQSLSGAVTVTRVAIAPDRSPPPASGEAEVAGIAPGVVN